MKIELFNDAVSTLIRTRDFCGDERAALADWEADNRELSRDERIGVVEIVNRRWNESRKYARVHKFNLGTNSHFKE